jgi:tetratricopeptide (TPR) repeat protein
MWPPVSIIWRHFTVLKGRYSEAEPLYQQALALRQKLLGDEHPDVATSFNNLAALYESQGRYSEAEPLYQQALALMQKLLGDEHPDVATSFNNLGSLRFSQGRYQEAATYLERALALIERLLGPDHPNTQTMRAEILTLCGKRLLNLPENRGQVPNR